MCANKEAEQCRVRPTLLGTSMRISVRNPPPLRCLLPRSSSSRKSSSDTERFMSANKSEIFRNLKLVYDKKLQTKNRNFITHSWQFQDSISMYCTLYHRIVRRAHYKRLSIKNRPVPVIAWNHTQLKLIFPVTTNQWSMGCNQLKNDHWLSLSAT